MKLAFSTLGCPDFDWPDILAMAKDFGFQGIEVRGLGRTIFSLRGKPFLPENVSATAKQLRSLHLEISCLSSGCPLCYPEKTRETISELKEYIDLAAKLNCKYVRVLGDEHPEIRGEVDDTVVSETLRAVVPYAEQAGVTLLVETNGVYSNTKRLAELLCSVPSDSIGALWDMHHPYRFCNESPEETVQNLGAYIKYTHIKDSIVEDGKISYQIIGEGDLPIAQFLGALRSINYEGYVTLEWLKSYAPNLSDAGIVFPHYSNFMASLLGSQAQESTLFENRARTGVYIWPKDKLIDLTFPQLLDRVATEFPDQYAFRFIEQDYTRTYSQFRDDVDLFARALIGLGVKPGDHVAVWALNIPEWFITFWAATRIGAVLVTVNTAYKSHELEYLLRQSDTHTLVMSQGYKDTVYSDVILKICPELENRPSGGPLYLKKLPFLRNIITVGTTVPGCLTWEESLKYAEKVSDVEVYRRAAGIRKDDVCNMQYTSGTTGFPKGVMLTHYNVINNGKSIGDNLDLSTADEMLIHVPMFHCFGMVLSMIACVTHGSTMSPISAFSPAKALECVRKEKITAINGVPTMFIAMLNHPDFDKTDFSNLRTGIMAGSPCPIKVMQDVLVKMNMSEICITYGQTEASPGCTMSRTTDSTDVRVNTVGSAMFGVECRIADPVTGEDLPVNTDGEFLARGYNVMKGYYKMPQATAAAIDENGWLHTGDLARVDEHGNYKITGRIKDMIIRGGENIYPKEIEEFLYTHPKVSDVQVIGVPDRSYGEEIMACIIPKAGEIITEDEIKDYVRSSMARHKVPRYVSFVDSFPMNAAGKILKYKMREQAVIDLNLQEDASVETA